MNLFFFEILIFFIFINTIFMINLNNPIHSALCLINIFLFTSGLLFYLNIEFIGFILILVYASGVSVLFLFSIMFFNIKIQKTSFFRSKTKLFTTFFFSFVFLFFNIWDLTFLPMLSNLNSYAYEKSIIFQNTIENFSSINNLSQLLYIDYFIHLILIGFLLFIVLLGILMIILPFNSKKKKNQLLFKQTARFSINSFLKIKKFNNEKN